MSDLRPSFGRRTRVRQQWIRCLTQTEARQALAELGEVRRKLGFLRWVGSTLTFLGRGNSGLRFAWHPCIASEKKVRQDFGLGELCFKDDAEKTAIQRGSQVGPP